MHQRRDQNNLVPFASYFHDGDYEMQDPSVPQPSFDENTLAQLPTFGQVETYFQQGVQPIRQNFEYIFEFMRLCRTTVHEMLLTNQKNDVLVLERIDTTWKALEDIFTASKNNFAKRQR